MGRICIVGIVAVVSALVAGYMIGMSVDSKEGQPIVEASGHWPHCPTPTPVPTPIPIYSLYSEWIRTPGTSIGWVRARDFVNMQRGFSVELKQVPMLSDAEWDVIAEKHGVRYTIAGRWVYGFQAVKGFPTLFGGAVIKDAWLPERLR